MSWDGTEVPIGYLIATTSRALKHYFLCFGAKWIWTNSAFPLGS